MIHLYIQFKNILTKRRNHTILLTPPIPPPIIFNHMKQVKLLIQSIPIVRGWGGYWHDVTPASILPDLQTGNERNSDYKKNHIDSLVLTLTLDLGGTHSSWTVEY